MTSTTSTLPCARTVPVEQFPPGHVHEMFGAAEDNIPTTWHTRATLVPCSTVVFGKASMMTMEEIARETLHAGQVQV